MDLHFKEQLDTYRQRHRDAWEKKTLETGKLGSSSSTRSGDTAPSSVEKLATSSSSTDALKTPSRKRSRATAETPAPEEVPQKKRMNSTGVVRKEISVLSWNIDGLADDEFVTRMFSIIDVIKRQTPDIVMLQEVTDPAMKFISEFLSRPYYIFIRGERSSFCDDSTKASSDGQILPYYCATLVSRYRFAPYTLNEAGQVVFYPNTIGKTPLVGETYLFSSSSMGRHLLKTRLCVLPESSADRPNSSLIVYNTHAESCADSRLERINQMKLSLACAQSDQKSFPSVHSQLHAVEPHDPQLNILYGGDMNARDTEVRECQANLTQLGFVDVWEAEGKPAETRYTWDMLLNTNHRDNYPPSTTTRLPRLRFDRLYLSSAKWSCRSMDLVGTTPFSGEGRSVFPSDHFGVLIKVNLQN